MKDGKVVWSDPLPRLITFEQVKRGIKHLIPRQPISKKYIQSMCYFVNIAIAGSMQGWVGRSLVVFDARNKTLVEMGQRPRVRMDETTLDMAFMPELTPDQQADADELKILIEKITEKWGVATFMNILKGTEFVRQEKPKPPKKSKTTKTTEKSKTK